MSVRLTRPIALVTGGGRGIGAATAALLAERGHAVVVNYRERGSVADQVVAAITDAGGQALAVQADVADEIAVVELFRSIDEEIWEEYIETLVNASQYEAAQTEIRNLLQENPENIRAKRIQSRIYTELRQ